MTVITGASSTSPVLTSRLFGAPIMVLARSLTLIGAWYMTQVETLSQVGCPLSPLWCELKCPAGKKYQPINTQTATLHCLMAKAIPLQLNLERCRATTAVKIQQCPRLMMALPGLAAWIPNHLQKQRPFVKFVEMLLFWLAQAKTRCWVQGSSGVH